MPKTETVLVSLSIVVTVPVNENLPEDAVVDDVADKFLDAISTRLSSVVAPLKTEPWFEEYCGTTYHYLDIDADSRFHSFMEENVGRCTKCGRWTSDYDAPDFVDLLIIGKKIEGKLFCNACTFFWDETTPLEDHEQVKK